MLSVVGHLSTDARFATNIAGKLDISEESPPVNSALTQFMYISRLPTLLERRTC